MAESPAKLDGAERRTGYKSWKKKYRKMRIVFDRKMHECEELHKKEAKAAVSVKRLAIENDRLLDLLLEINNCPQIPPERRIDLSLKPSHDKTPCLAIDPDHATRRAMAAKRLAQMLSDVPHSTYHSAKESNSSWVADLVAPEGESHPANFLTADDVDDYLCLVDTAINPDTRPPRLVAPLAHPTSRLAPNPQLKNPTSVTNWLRKYKPEIFLQDGETHDGDEPEAPSAAATGPAILGGGGGGGVSGGSGGAHASARKSRPSGGSKADRSSKGSAKSKKPRGDRDASHDDDPELGSTPLARGKRKRDDDAGYRPKGSSSRPSKKKRKSDVEATPTARKAKKDKDGSGSKGD